MYKLTISQVKTNTYEVKGEEKTFNSTEEVSFVSENVTDLLVVVGKFEGLESVPTEFKIEKVVE